MPQIEVSPETAKEFKKLQTTLKEVYKDQKISDDEIMGAMIQGFFDSLEHMKKTGHHHDDHECCWGGECKDDWKCKC